MADQTLLVDGIGQRCEGVGGDLRCRAHVVEDADVADRSTQDLA